MMLPGSVTSFADLSEKPDVNSVEPTVGGPEAGVGVTVGVSVGPEVEVDVGVGVLVFGACGLLALAEPPRMLSINASTSTTVRSINRPFCFLI